MKRIFLGAILLLFSSSSRVLALPDCSLNIYPQPTLGTNRYTVTLTNNTLISAYRFVNNYFDGEDPGGNPSNTVTSNYNYWHLGTGHGYQVNGFAGIPISNDSLTYEVDLTFNDSFSGVDMSLSSSGSTTNDVCNQGHGSYTITYNDLGVGPITNPTPAPVGGYNCSLNIYPQPTLGTQTYLVTLTNNTSVPAYNFVNNYFFGNSPSGHPSGLSSVSDWFIHAPVTLDYMVTGTAGTPFANGSSISYSANLTTSSYFSGVDLGLKSYGSATNDICNQGGISYITFNPPPTTPTPSPTATPTPTQILPATKKVVVVPGIEATWNSDALLNCKMNGYSGSWSLGDYATQYYQPLYDSLNEAGWDVEPFYYDWRQPISVSAERLIQFIELNTNGGEKVNLVGHSMGGLIGREYVSEEQDNNRLERMLTAGTPHKGAVVAYPAWSAGDLWKSNLVEKIALTLLLKRCDAWPTHDKTAIRQYIPSIRDLLPIFDYLKDRKTWLFKDATIMESKNDWLLGSNFASPFWGVKVGTLAGGGQSTLTNLDVRERNLVDQLLGNWEDGKPVGKNLVDDGDDTVLVENAQLTDADNRVINQRHANLASSPEAITEILDFLGTPIEAVNSLAEPRSALVIAGVGADFEITDPSGKGIKNKDGLIVIYDPPAGRKYKLTILGAVDETWVGVAKFKADGGVEWKEFKGKNAKRFGEEIFWK